MKTVETGNSKKETAKSHRPGHGNRVAIVHQGELKVQGRVDELVAQHQCDLEKVFLKIVGYQGQL